jgi:hypothetical protein
MLHAPTNPDGTPAPRLTDPLSLSLVVTGGALVPLAEGPLRQFGAAYLALAVGRIWLARWLFAADGPAPEADVRPVRGWERVAGAIGVAAVGALGVTTFAYASNVPFWDEFVSTLKFAVNYGEMTGRERLSALFASHYGHRILTTRLATLAQWRLTGELDFIHLMAIAFACLAGTAGVVYAGVRRGAGALAPYAPFLLLLFQPQYHQLTLWGFSVQHFSALFFESLAVYLLARGGNLSYTGAVVALVLATFSFGNGILVGIVGLAYLCVQRRDRAAIGWLAATTLLAVLYFHDLGIGSAQGARPGVLAQGAYLLEFLGSAATLGYFTDFLGAMDAETGRYPALVWLARGTGTLVLAGFVYLTLQRFWRRNFTVYGLFALTMASAVLAALHRTGADYASPFMSRYTIHSALCLGLLYLAFVELHAARARRLLPVTLAVAAAFCAGSYAVTLPYLALHRGDMRFSAWMASNALYTGEPVTIATPFFDLALLKKAADQKVYTIPAASILAEFKSSRSAGDSTHPAVVFAGENAIAYTGLLSAPGSAGKPVPAPFVDARGTVDVFDARPLSAIPVHERLLRNSGYAGATHLLCVPKAP